VAHGRVRHLRRSGAVGGVADDRRPRGRDPRVRAGGVLELPATFARAADADPEIDASLFAVGERKLATPKELEGKSEARQAQLLVVRSEPEATRLAERARALDYTVAEVRRSEAKRQPKPPFKTSTLQGEASKLGFSARQTMAVAQQLYEGINLGGEQVGLITYMRTDSLNLSDQVLGEITSTSATPTASGTRSTSRGGSPPPRRAPRRPTRRSARPRSRGPRSGSVATCRASRRGSTS
jgi:hypothetical protein